MNQGHNKNTGNGGGGKACGRLRDQGLISGFLDGELTQADRQLLEVHIESCPDCRRQLESLRSLREATMNMKFDTPSADEWDEHAQGIFSRTSRGFGWFFMIFGAIWAVLLGAYGLFLFFTSPEGWLPKLMVFGLITGVAALFLSVLVDRIKALKTDRYNKVVR